ncbi:contractile injection system protein, VgrG/Pvc8 family [uncultured Paracoccus sp.]|uniref:contractile injection system protein, VgrG/Pvc8 family n=1 Tax=uncultured Paracoccus sp. TaxID=189685 RepID=UPI0025E57DC5|nr:contractile injection system protein, VgrG/Pvc8 family [uncultured Paracoccus sp.]
MTPDFKIIAAGVNITPQIKDRLLSLTITDEAGIKADTVEITLDDRDGLIELPAPGAPMLVFLGYRETGLIPMGLFTSDEVTVTSPPATLTIRAKAADLGGGIKDQKTRSWDNMTIGDITATIADEHGLEPKVAERFKSVLIDHIDQTEESDIGFLDRMGRDHDALVSVKGGALLFMGKGEGRSASGLPIPPRPVLQRDTTAWTLTLTTREACRSVVALWQDTDAARRQEVTAGEGSPTLRLRHIHQTEAEASAAATAKLDEFTRGSDTFEATFPGDPLIAAETRILAAGFRAGVNGLWSITTATHTLDGSGFTTSISAERPAAN